MTYAIGNVVYGIDLQGPSPYDRSAVDEFADIRDAINELTDDDNEIITRQYSGNGEQPLYFGIDLGGIDECNTVEGVDLIKMLTITDVQKELYTKRLDELQTEAPTVYERLRMVEPRTFITWGSS